jgi:hypothetical protein
MGGLDWQALPTVIDMLGITDPEPLVWQLVSLREMKRAKGTD